MTENELKARLQYDEGQNNLWADRALDKQGNWGDVSWGCGPLVSVGPYLERVAKLPKWDNNETLETYRLRTLLPDVYCGSNEKSAGRYQHYGVVAWYPYEHLQVSQGFRHCYAYFPNQSYINEMAVLYIASQCSGYGDRGQMPTLENLRAAWFDSVRRKRGKSTLEHFYEGVEKYTPTGEPGRVRLMNNGPAYAPWRGDIFDFYIKEGEMFLLLPDHPDAWPNMRGDHMLCGKFRPDNPAKQVGSMPS